MMEYTKPAEIERRSMEIITETLTDMGITLPEENAAVIRRVIHTSADFDYAENLQFTPGAVAAAVDTLKRGTPIVTDTRMALSGINAAGLRRLGGSAECYMSDQETADAAKAEGTTRAVISMRRAAALHPGCILAVGNAPTALFEIVKLMREGLRPALVVAVPVGFVNVVEAKEAVFSLCLEIGIPCIAAMGRKGGSNVAAAICNALIYQAAGLQDPAARN